MMTPHSSTLLNLLYLLLFDLCLISSPFFVLSFISMFFIVTYVNYCNFVLLKPNYFFKLKF